jgi:hypothetical protein
MTNSCSYKNKIIYILFLYFKKKNRVSIFIFLIRNKIPKRFISKSKLIWWAKVLYWVISISTHYYLEIIRTVPWLLAISLIKFPISFFDKSRFN